MKHYIGIDLGTTYSAVSVLDETGRPTIVHNRDGQNITPSCVYIDGEMVLVGEDARKSWDIEPNKVAARFKREMGTERVFKMDGKSFSPTDLSAFVLKKLKADSEAALGEIAEAVVTIPANFTNEAREATLEAARRAGLNINFIINEPTAAALYYAYKNGKELHGTYAVYDLGGGTFDVSIIRVNGQDIDVVTSHGVSKLGGDDFDSVLQALVAKKFKVLTGKELEKNKFTKNAAEDVKRSLSKLNKKQVAVADQVIEITRAEFEQEISHLIAQAEMLCEAALDEGSIGHGDLSGVFLVGGSTRIPAVIESVKRVFKVDPVSTVNVDEVVALGASLYAAYKSDKKFLSSAQKTALSTIKITEITNYCFGTTVQQYDELRKIYNLKNSIIISKNSKIPCSVTKDYYTVGDGQEALQCDVTSSTAPETDKRFVKTVWEGSMPLPSGRPKGQRIDITFSFDDNNVMHCKFLDVQSGKHLEVELDQANKKSSSNDDIERFLVE